MCVEADVVERESKTSGNLAVERRSIVEALRQLRQVEICRQRAALAMAHNADDVADRFLKHDPQVLRGEQSGRAQMSEQRGGPHGWMAGEWQLAGRCENFHARAVDRVPRFEDENGLGKIELGGDRLHTIAVEALAVEDHGERIAGERRLGEYVERLKSAGHKIAIPR